MAVDRTRARQALASLAEGEVAGMPVALFDSGRLGPKWMSRMARTALIDAGDSCRLVALPRLPAVVTALVVQGNDHRLRALIVATQQICRRGGRGGNIELDFVDGYAGASGRSNELEVRHGRKAIGARRGLNVRGSSGPCPWRCAEVRQAHAPTSGV